MWNVLENLNSAVLQTLGGAVLLILVAGLAAGLIALLNDRRKL